MKLNIEATSDRGGRPVKKDGNAYIRIELSRGNVIAYSIVLDTDGLMLVNEQTQDILANHSINE